MEGEEQDEDAGEELQPAAQFGAEQVGGQAKAEQGWDGAEAKGEHGQRAAPKVLGARRDHQHGENQAAGQQAPEHAQAIIGPKAAFAEQGAHARHRRGAAAQRGEGDFERGEDAHQAEGDGGHGQANQDREGALPADQAADLVEQGAGQADGGAEEGVGHDPAEVDGAEGADAGEQAGARAARGGEGGLAGGVEGDDAAAHAQAVAKTADQAGHKGQREVAEQHGVRGPGRRRRTAWRRRAR